MKIYPKSRHVTTHGKTDLMSFQTFREKLDSSGPAVSVVLGTDLSTTNVLSCKGIG